MTKTFSIWDYGVECAQAILSCAPVATHVINGKYLMANDRGGMDLLTVVI